MIALAVIVGKRAVTGDVHRDPRKREAKILLRLEHESGDAPCTRPCHLNVISEWDRRQGFHYGLSRYHGLSPVER
mgnify:CR=1 FL=1